MKYYDKSVGQGSTIVFLPGSGWCGTAGSNIADELKSDHQIRMIDLPGIGRSEGIAGRVTAESMSRWVHEYLDNQGITRCHLIGHSLGGAMALAFSVRHPKRVLSLTLLDIGYERVPRFPIQMLGNGGYLAPLISCLERFFGPSILRKVMGSDLAEDAGKRDSYPDTLTDRIDDVKHRGWYALQDDGYLREALEFEPSMTVEGMELWLALYRMNLPSLLRQVSYPCLLMYGTFPDSEDKVQHRVRKNVDKCRRANLGIEYQAVASGHYVHWANEHVVKQIGEFVRRSDAQLD